MSTRSLTTVLLATAAALVAAGCGSTPSREASLRDAAVYNVRLGIAYLQQGNLAVAKEKLERAQRQDPRSPEVHSGLALLYERLGNLEKADHHHRTALRLAPRDPEISNNYAVYLCKTGRREEGVRRFLDAARNPLYATPEAAYTNAGVCLRAAHRDDEARENFERALQVKPNFAEAAFQLADLEYRSGRLNEAKAQIDRYLGSFDATPDLLLLGVRVARALGDRLAAERYARRLRLDFPGSDQARQLAELISNPG